jgi:hypothetical protein
MSSEETPVVLQAPKDMMDARRRSTAAARQRRENAFVGVAEVIIALKLAQTAQHEAQKELGAYCAGVQLTKYIKDNR